MTRLRPLYLALSFLAVSALLRLGLWTQGGVGVDAVSAVTPGDVAVVGAGVPDSTEATLDVEALVRRAAYLSGGIHKAVDASSEWILVRPAHQNLDTPRALEQHLQLVQAVVELLHGVAPEARISLLVGAVPGAPLTVPEGLLGAVALWSASPEADYLDVLDLSAEEWEPTDVPDGGEVADTYPAPIALLECDAVVNVARAGEPPSALRNLEGLAGTPESDGWTPQARWIDLALLSEVSYTVLDLLDHDGDTGPVVLASPDGIAVDRVGMALVGQTPETPIFEVAADRWLGVGKLSEIKVNGLDLAGSWSPAPDSSAVPE